MSGSSSVRRRVFALVGVAAVAVGVALGGGGAAAAPRSPAPPDAVAFSDIVAGFTSNHQHLGLFIGASRNDGPGAGTTYTVSWTGSHGAESHDWGFPIPASALKVSSTGNGSLNVPPAKLAPYGKTKLVFRPIGKPKKRQCSPAAYVRTQKVTVSGEFYFDTKTNSWGHYGSKTKRMTLHGTATIAWAYGQLFTECIGSTTTEPCAKTLSWGSSNHNSSMTLGGGTVGKRGYISGSRSVKLKKPKKASRDDVVDTTAPVSKLKKGGGGSAKLSVRTTGGVASGAATVSSTMAGAGFPHPCGKNKTETESFWQASLKNAKKPLRLNEQIFGPITLPSGSIASIATSSG